jgi:hypothetical protein
VEGLGSESYIGEIRVSVHRGKLDFPSCEGLRRNRVLGLNKKLKAYLLIKRHLKH